ncbi:MAG: class I SAM-dependent methyltransferase [Verrucomicrobia bacterium]|nr:class I SAM-dependent methyltransferase [Verrucomicrobiota bacterium]
MKLRQLGPDCVVSYLSGLIPRFWTSSNRQAYNARQVVREYASATYLQPPERTILDLVAGFMKNGKMLDIGVGGGRTTLHFAPLAKEYIGIDYAEKMIEACHRRFRPLPPNVSFKVGDANDLSAFRSGYFDFVLASFNCIDYSASHDDRFKTLQEMRRVCRKGGLVCFSTHNLLYGDLFKIRLDKNPFHAVTAVYRYLWLMVLNGGRKRFANRDYAWIRDEAHAFSLKTYYITPLKQLEQLKELGFEGVRIFRLDGCEVVAGSDLRALRDGWLYYLCTVR